MNISKKMVLAITALIIICLISLRVIINAQSSYSETTKETDKISSDNDLDLEPSEIPELESNDESAVIESTNENPNNSCDNTMSNSANMNTSNSTNTNTSNSTNTYTPGSLEAKYSALARNVRLEPEGVTVSRYSDQDVDNPAMAGSLLTHKIISEELKITKRRKTTVTNEEKRLLSLIIYHETCSEPYEGKLAAANCILNRLYTKGYWPNDIMGILQQEGQFETWRDCQWNVTVSEYDSGNFTTDNHLLAIRAIDDALNGINNIGTRVAWSMYCVVKNNKELKNPVRIQNNLFWDY